VSRMYRQAMHRLARVAVALTAVAGALALAAPAHAALPDAAGFVLWNGGATVPSGTWPAATTVVPGAPGQYKITFAGLAARGGVVHVTAVNDAPRWCQAAAWVASGTDEVVLVNCYAPGGTPAATAFSAFFESSSRPPAPINGRFGYVDSNPNALILSEYNSSGAANGVSVLGIGQWLVKLPGLGTTGPVDGSVQVTAVNPATPARCKVIRWVSTPGDQLVAVACFDAFGAPFPTRFTMTYQYNQSLYGAGWPPRQFGYAWNAPPLGPASTNFNSQLGAGANGILPSGTGLSLVTFPNLGAAPPDNIQVTAAGPGPEFCGLSTFWVHSGPTIVVRNVSCYDSLGVRTNTGFTISANSEF
jgi:hypothetical protein